MRLPTPRRTRPSRSGSTSSQSRRRQIPLPADDPVPPEGDPREPTARLSKEWYRTNRIDEQIALYRKGRAKNEAFADRLSWVAFASGLAGRLRRAQRLGGNLRAVDRRDDDDRGSIAAYGLVDRRKYLISSYAAIQASLEGIKALNEKSAAGLADFVTVTEDLLNSEHRAWQPQMLAMQHWPQDKPQQPQPAGGEVS